MLTEPVTFKARIQKGYRIQVPVLIRWMFKLEPGEIFLVRVWLGYPEEFYARLTRDGRIYIPKVVVDEFIEYHSIEESSIEGYTVEVTLRPAVA